MKNLDQMFAMKEKLNGIVKGLPKVQLLPNKYQRKLDSQLHLRAKYITKMKTLPIHKKVTNGQCIKT